MAVPRGTGAAQGTAERESAEYANEGDARFILRSRSFRNQQYASVYFTRLALQRPVLLAAAIKRWPGVPVCGVLDMKEKAECVVIGTLYKHMQLKPSVLDEYSQERSQVPLARPHNFVSDDDYLVLEDERGRVRLVGDVVKPAHFVTGIVVAVKGSENKDGDFQVESICLPGIPAFPSTPADANGHAMDIDSRGTGANKKKKHVLIVSGLRFGEAPASGVEALHRQLLLDFVTGHVNTEEEQELSASIVRVVVAGDSCASAAQTHPEALAAATLSPKDVGNLLAPLKDADLYLSQLASAGPLDIMPGASDPANFALPQQPLHKCLLQATSQFSSVVRAPNPHLFQVGATRFLGTSGQNVEDLDRFSLADLPAGAAADRAGTSGSQEAGESQSSDISRRGEASTGDADLQHLERCLRWRHLAPTAPDTLGCYPFQMDDPFLLSECPDVFFCGNRPQFATKFLPAEDADAAGPAGSGAQANGHHGARGHGVRLVVVPSFSLTSQVALVDLDTLECFPMSFSSSNYA